jgi:hypothetical protein
VAYADSGIFPLDTTGTLPPGGVAYADSGVFPLDTTGTLPPGGVAYADSGIFTLNTLNNVVNSVLHFTSISISGTALSIQAVNGTVSGQYVLLGTTNVAKPLSEWTPLLTNYFDGGGNLNLSTNIINPAVPQQFYILISD